MAICCFASIGAINAQLAAGSTLPGNVTGLDVVSDQSVDVQAWLDDGKTVVIDVFATWCGPCWGFHVSGWLEDMNHRYGPEGTDQIRILGVEADDDTAVSEIFSSALGNWTINPETGENVNYSIIDNPSAASTLGIAYYPSLYIIQPSGVLVEIGTLDPNPRYDEDFWLKAMGIDNDPAGRLSTDLALSPFCDELVINDSTVDLFNPTSGDIESATLDYVINGTTVSTIEYDGPTIGPFQTGQVTIPGQTLTEQTNLEVNLVSINGTPGDYQSIVTSADQYLLETKTMTVNFTTDNYPSETTWRIGDDVGNIFFAIDSYMPGNDDQYGGGGPDALTTHTYEVDVPADLSSDCLRFTINDSFGDGLTLWDPAQHEPPGIEIIDENGVVVKDNYLIFDTDGVTAIGVVYDGDFATTTQVLVATEFVVSVDNIQELAEMKAFPSPTYETLNLELNFTNDIDYNVSILDAYGKTVKVVGNFNSSLNQAVNVAELNAGMYFVNVQTEKGTNVIRFIKM